MSDMPPPQTPHQQFLVEKEEIREALERQQEQRKRWLLIGALLVVCLLITGRRYLIAHSTNTPFFRQPAADGTKATSATPSPTPEPGLTMLLMGRGGAGHDGGALADTIVLARILESQHRIILLSLPRDLWVQIPFSENDSEMGKINSAYAIGIDSHTYKDKKTQYTGASGGGTLAKDVVTAVTGLPIDKYMTVDFSGFEQAVDTIGGVDLTVDRTFTDFEYPIAGREDLDCSATASATPSNESSEADLIAAGKLDANSLPELPRSFPCRYELLHFDAGKQHMSGAVALKYVRSRHSNEDGNDFSRSRRQKILLQAVADKLFSIGAVTKIPTFLTTLRSHVDTDLGTAELIGMLPKAQDYRGYAITSLTLSTDNYLGQGYTQDGQFELFPLAGVGKYEAIKDWIARTVDPSKKAVYPLVEVSGYWQNSSASASLRDTLNAAGYPTKLAKLAMKDATSSATLLIRSDKISPESLQKIKELAKVKDAYVRTASASATADLTILLP